MIPLKTACRGRCGAEGREEEERGKLVIND